MLEAGRLSRAGGARHVECPAPLAALLPGALQEVPHDGQLLLPPDHSALRQRRRQSLLGLRQLGGGRGRRGQLQHLERSPGRRGALAPLGGGVLHG